MAKKIFYTLHGSDINDFKETVQNAFGLVSNEDDEFGYFIVNGKQYGITPEQYNNLNNAYLDWVKNGDSIKEHVITSQNDIVEMKADIIDIQDKLSLINDVAIDDDANSFVIDNVNYKLNINDNIISVEKYAPATIQELSMSLPETSPVTIGDGIKYVGTTYTIGWSTTSIPSTQTLTINVSNVTANKYKLSIYDGTSYIMQDTDYRVTNGTINMELPVDTTNTSLNSITGKTTWEKFEHVISTSTPKTFTVYLTEINKQPISKTIKQQQVFAKATITPKCPILKGTDGTYQSCITFVKDILFDEISDIIDLGIFEFAAGEIPTVAIPTCLNKSLYAYSEYGAFNDNSWKANNKITVSLNGCTTEYDIYCMCDDLGNPKQLAGNCVENIKLK